MSHLNLISNLSTEVPIIYYLFYPAVSLSGHYWIGFNDIEQESDFRWVNGAPLYYLKFPASEPNGRRAENCGALKNEKFDNIACSRDEDILCSSIGKYVQTVLLNRFSVN